MNPSETRKQVDRMVKKLKEEQWPNSTIVYQQRLWTPEALRKEHPKLKCLF